MAAMDRATRSLFPPFLDHLRFNNVSRFIHPTCDRAANGTADQRSQPEQPKLSDIIAACEQRRASAASGIDRGVSHWNRDQMDQSQSKTNPNTNEADGSTFGRCSNDDEDKEKVSRISVTRHATRPYLPGLSLRKSPYQQRFPLRRCRSALRAVVGLDGTASACVTLIDLVDQRLLALRLAR
jgi:hypothetical protein